MEKWLQKDVPKWLFWGIVLGFFYALSLFTAYKIGQLSKGEIVLQRQNEKIKGRPIEVPLFIHPDKVKHQRRFRFSFDDPSVLQFLRKRERLDLLLEGSKSDMEVFKRLMSWVRSQWTPGRPDPYPPIDAIAILDKIRRGETGGFCAQYCFVLCQALQSLGYKARYVTIKGHEVIEVWSSEFQKWVMLDPTYEIYVKKDWIPLSVIEIHDFSFRKEPLVICSTRTLPDQGEYLSRFKNFAVWIKNDHVSFPINFYDIERYKVYFLNSIEERLYIPPQSLYTSFVEDLYFNPWEDGEGLEKD